MKATVNGTAAAVDASPDEPLVEVLRDDLGLTGTKLVCGTGVCGACTVLVDGTPRLGCLTPCAAVEDREVTTVEGLGGTHPVQRAFAASDGLQCGYCTPGFVVEAAAFADRWRAANGDVAPPRAAIAEALAGHLCRCGAYEGIYAAVAAACRGEHDLPGAAPERVEAVAKVTGAARYTTDVRLDGQLEGVIIRSPLAHARVGPLPASKTPLVDLLPPDRTVRYAGQPVAAVAGATRAEALTAAAAVEIAYEALPAVVDTTEAADPGAPVVHASRAERKAAPGSGESMAMPARWRGNVRGPNRMSWRGGTAARRVAAARERGDDRLVAGTFTTAAQVHTALEPHACVASWEGDGGLRLHVSTQAVGAVAEAAAKRWGLDPERVHVVAEHVGGGFGAKLGLSVEVVAAVELARAHGARRCGWC